MTKAVFPGSFDPPTHGHLNLIRRGARLFDSLDVVIAVNPQKTPILSPEKRRTLLENHVAKLKGVRVTVFSGLLVDYCRSTGARVLIRGLRSLSDFGYELELSIVNKQLDGDVETVFLPADPQYSALRSSTVRELLDHGRNLGAMVPPDVEAALREN